MATKAKTKKQGLLKFLKNTMFNKGSIDIPFFVILMTIVTIGLIMLFSASYTYSYYNRGSSTEIFTKQLLYAAIGIVAMFFVSRIRYEYFKLAAVIGVPITYFLLVIVLFLPDNVQEGFHRWINLKIITFQPSEIAKICLILILAYWLDKYHEFIVGKVPSELGICKMICKMSKGKHEIYKSLTYVLAFGFFTVSFALLVYLENHLSGALLILAIGVTVLWLGEVKQWWFIVGIAVAALGAILLITNPEILKEYAGERITSWIDRDTADPLGVRWQTNNSLYAIGSGGFLGTGLGQSKQKHLFVSEPQNDFVFSIVCEELGFVGATAIILLFAALIYRGVKIGLNAKDRFASILATGIVFQIGIQVALNIAVVSDALPNTGISLPFFSAGGTSLVILLAEMGMVLSISRSVNRKDQ